MAITIGDLTRDVRTIEIEWDGETMQLTYRPGAYTPEVESQFVNQMVSSLPGNAFAEMLAKLIVNWEMLDENGNEIPHDAATLKGIYTAFLTHVFKEISTDMQAAREDRKNFDGGSQRRAKSASARNGTH